MVTCSNCGCKIQSGQKNCPYCGAPVKNVRRSNQVASERRENSDGDEITQLIKRSRRRDLHLEILDELRKAYVLRIILLAFVAGNLIFEFLLLVVLLGR